MKNTFAIPTIVGGQGSGGTGGGSSSGVSSVNGRTGNVVLSKKDVGLQNYDSDLATLEGQIGALQAELDDTAKTNERNTFTKNIIVDVDDPATSDEVGIVLGDNNGVLSDTNSSYIIKNIKNTDNTQETYVGGTKVVIESKQGTTLLSTNAPTITRYDSEDKFKDYVNIDSGNISDYVSGGGGAASNDKYGIEADYALHYGILDCPNGLIDYKVTSKTITVNPGIVLKITDNGNAKTTIASKITYDVETTGKFTLFYAEGSLLEAGDVYYQVKEPTNGVSSYVAWYNPETKVWKFSSVDTGNVFREAKATPLADINASSDGIISVSYIGYRIFDDDIFAQQSEIESINETISIINDNVNGLSENAFTKETLLGGNEIEIIPESTEGGIDEHTLACWHFDDNLDNAVEGSKFFITTIDTAFNNIDPKFGTGALSRHSQGYSKHIKLIENLLLDEYTIDFWLKNPANDWIFGSSTGYVLPDNMAIQYKSTLLSFYCSKYTINVSNEISNVNDGNWHHIAITANETNVNIFVDGIKRGEATRTGKIQLVSNTQYSTYMDKGVIDELRISDIVRYTEDFNVPTKPYKTSEPTGNYVVNYIGDGDSIQVAYTNQDGPAETTLNQFCDAVYHDIDNLTLLTPTNSKVASYTKANLPDALSSAGMVAMCTDLDNALVFCNGTSWKKIVLEDLQ